MKRYRNAKGQLTISLEEIKKKNIVEASDYYKPGSIYLNAADGRKNMFICFRFREMENWHTSRASTATTYLFRSIVWALFFRMSQAMAGNCFL